MAMLVWMCFEARGEGSVCVLHLPFVFAVLGVKEIAQDRKQPCIEVGAALEFVGIGPGAQDGVLNEIIRTISVMGERGGKGAQALNGGEQFIPQRCLNTHAGASLTVSQSGGPTSPNLEEEAVG